MNLIKIKDLVHSFLIEYPETRDNDNLLQLKIWGEQMPELRSKLTTFWDFALIYKNGKLASSESIRRTRQKYQEKYPELRGEKYKKRHKEQTNVKNQLRTM